MTDQPETPAFKYDSKKIPTDPGCYLYWDKDDKLLYVGKAKNLRKRVSSYFQKTKQSPKTALMLKKIARIETRTVNSEIEALILENNLVKQYKPKFNVLLRDDKNFLYLRITNEDEPKLEITRRVLKDGSTYFGPKTSSKEFRKTIKFCQKYFGAKMVRSNQDYYINQLLAKETSPEEYRANIERMKRFLKGNTKEVLQELQAKMQAFAVEKNFEAAAKVRDTILSIDESTQKQTVEFTDLIDRDFINYVIEDKKVYLVRLAFRQGKLRDSNQMTLKVSEFSEAEEILSNFLMQFYERVTEYPREIFLPAIPADKEALETLLSTEFFEGQRVELFQPQKGDKKTILDLAAKNAQHFAEKDKVQALSQAENFAKALPEIAEALNLPEPPKRIECYDISHFAGKDTVASMVVFVDGKSKKSEYRRFKVKTLGKGKIDDFASMEEVLGRRFRRTAAKPGLDSSSGLTMKPVQTDEEWKIYHAIRKKELFERHHPEIEYNRNHPDDQKAQNMPVVFYEKDQIIGAARLDKLSKTRLCLRTFAILESRQGQGLGTLANALVEAHALEHGFKSLVLNARPEAKAFYQKLGYETDFWKGDAGDDQKCQPMGKKLLAKKDKWQLPDLVVIDGGKGQLSSVMKIFKTLEVEGFDPQTQVISLAKREEQIFRPGVKEPLELDFDSAALKLLQRLRDEAHRFAISFNRSLRQKSQQKSILDEIAGIGPTTKKKLMQTFESVSGIRDASDTELLKVVNQKQLKSLRRQL
jgi:excinuclease ABC subunit C